MIRYTKQERSYRGVSLACLENKSRNEEAIKDLLGKGFSLPTLSTVEYSSGYLLFTCFWIYLVRVLATTEKSRRSQAIHENSRALIPGNYIIVTDQNSDLHGTSFQSSPKIYRMPITKFICIQWKFTTPDHGTFANLDSSFLFFDHCSVHLFQSNQRLQAI